MKVNVKSFREEGCPYARNEIIQRITKELSSHQLYALQLVKAKATNEWILFISNPKVITMDELRNKFFKQLEEEYPAIKFISANESTGELRFSIA